MTVEFLRAWEDGHWDTEIVDVPDDEIGAEAFHDVLIEWAVQTLGVQTQYRRVVCFAVMGFPEPEDVRPWESSQRHDLPAGMRGED